MVGGKGFQKNIGHTLLSIIRNSSNSLAFKYDVTNLTFQSGYTDVPQLMITIIYLMLVIILYVMVGFILFHSCEFHSSYYAYEDCPIPTH